MEDDSRTYKWASDKINSISFMRKKVKRYCVYKLSNTVKAVHNGEPQMVSSMCK